MLPATCHRHYTVKGSNLKSPMPRLLLLPIYTVTSRCTMHVVSSHMLSTHVRSACLRALAEGNVKDHISKAVYAETCQKDCEQETTHAFCVAVTLDSEMACAPGPTARRHKARGRACGSLSDCHRRPHHLRSHPRCLHTSPKCTQSFEAV